VHRADSITCDATYLIEFECLYRTFKRNWV